MNPALRLRLLADVARLANPTGHALQSEIIAEWGPSGRDLLIELIKAGLVTRGEEAHKLRLTNRGALLLRR